MSKFLLDNLCLSTRRLYIVEVSGSPGLSPTVGPGARADAPVLLRCEGVGYRYGGQVALAEVELALAPGHSLGLLGPNGAGKSTLMRCLAGVARPSQGRITIGGRDPTDPATRARVGVAPQDLALYDGLTAAENLAFVGRLYDLRGPRLRDRVEAMLELAGLRARARDRVGTFSGGMKRRLGLACAAIHQPELLLLDEPTVGVDPQSREHLLTALGALRTGGVAIVYSTHLMDEVERVCDRVAIIDHGRVLADGAVSEVLARHGGATLIELELSGPLPPAWAALGAERVSAERVRLASTAPWADLAQLAASAGAEGAGAEGLRGLRVTGPSLERAFLGLTGRELRD